MATDQSKVEKEIWEIMEGWATAVRARDSKGTDLIPGP